MTVPYVVHTWKARFFPVWTLLFIDVCLDGLYKASGLSDSFTKKDSPRRSTSYRILLLLLLLLLVVASKKAWQAVGGSFLWDFYR